MGGGDGMLLRIGGMGCQREITGDRNLTPVLDHY